MSGWTVAVALGVGAALGVAVTPTIPLWLCKCGALNRLRDTTCRHCGDPKPEAHA